jgi:hypothetical protein
MKGKKVYVITGTGEGIDAIPLFVVMGYKNIPKVLENDITTAYKKIEAIVQKNTFKIVEKSKYWTGGTEIIVSVLVGEHRAEAHEQYVIYERNLIEEVV